MSEKVKKSAEEYLPWAGWFAHVTLDPEVAAHHPGWWQRQRKYIRECVEAGREIDSAELQRLGQGDQPATKTYHIPEGVSLPTLKRRFRGTIPTEEALKRLRTLVNGDFALARCTAFGDGRELLRHQPTQGLFAYIWLHVLCKKGLIPSVPVTAIHELEEGIHDLTGEWVSIGAETEALTLWLDAQITNLLRQVA